MAEKTLGGDRLGSGKQMTQELHNYGMNSFNQGRDFKSTMAAGILYPCFKEIGTNFGTFDIDIDAFVRTLPTKGPLFGSFKMQVDLFNVPFRLYQGVLHNNPVDIGLNMHQVYLPKIQIATIDGKDAPKVQGSNENNEQINESALEKYLGISGIGHQLEYSIEPNIAVRNLQCVPELGYYDIFKNYYSNKQEEDAYVITPGTPKEANVIKWVSQGNIIAEYDPYNNELFTLDINNAWSFYFNIMVELPQNYNNDVEGYVSDGNLRMDNENGRNEIYVDNTNFTMTYNAIPGETNKWQITAVAKTASRQSIINNILGTIGDPIAQVKIVNKATNDWVTADITLTPFKLKNIDKMREKLLANNSLGSSMTIKNDTESATVWGTDSGLDNTGLPYSTLVKQTTEGITYNAFKQNGLVVKTYQSDLFNNWLDNSLINYIEARTKIDTTSGGFTPDTLILQEKIYKLLNRIIVAGGTYYDWQEATYGEGVARMCEIPMYIGGMSTEIMFEEVINNSATEADGRYQALGSLGGKGTNINKKGGNDIHVRMDEPGYIIGICSITPRISQCQGNDWDRTELVTMDDLHKPELDGIGFQDLMVEQMAWWNTVLSAGEPTIIARESVGKQTAWINYQTAVDKVYGDFANQEGYSFMVLNRNYEHDNIWGVKDMTTYIDPSKFNYAFAYQDLDAQNFWVQLSFKCISRRKMGAQQLPTL